VAIFHYEPQGPDELRLIKDVPVAVVKKNTNGMWEGRQLGQTGLFPSYCVDLLDTEALQIPELSRERRFVFSLESLKSVEKISAYELQLSFSNPKLEVFLSTRFVLASTRNRKLLANDWLEAFSTIHARKPSELVPREEHNALSSSLEKLMGSSRLLSTDKILDVQHFDTILLPEHKAVRSIHLDPEELVSYNIDRTVYVYPSALRINYSNFNPVPFWNCGIQYVAMNYHLSDTFMQLYRGKFRDNGNCGY
jgi:hypothetical protein